LKELTAVSQKTFIDKASGRKVTVKSFKCDCGFEKQTTI
jgi:hypothetical protein